MSYISKEKVLLIFPPDAWGRIDRFCQPLGILMLATVLKHEGIDVKVLDLHVLGWYPNKVIQFIEKGNYTHVGITILTPSRNVAFSILRMVKKINPKIITLVGGPHITYMKESILNECKYIDIAVSGEADLKISEIIRSPTKRFYDLGYIKDLNNLMIIDRSFVRHNRYNKLKNIWIGDSATVKWIRGCPWRKCKFCSRTALTMAHRKRSIDSIIEELSILQNEQKYKGLVLVDDNLEINSKITKTIFRTKIREGLDIPFWAQARAEHVDEEGMRLMSRAGASGLIIGLESIVPRMIDKYKKISGDPRNWYKVLDRVFELADKYNIIAAATIIIGGPTESLKEIQATFEYCRKAKLDIIHPFVFRFEIGSDFWREAIENGQISPTQYSPCNDKRYGTSELTAEELMDLTRKAEFFINSPITNPMRYFRLIRKSIKQRNPLLGRNVLQLPLIAKDILSKHSYGMAQELYG